MLRTAHLLRLTSGLLAGLTINACTTDDDNGSTVAGACQMVIDACHEKDDGSDDMINGCHSRAHDGDDAQCSTDLDECVAACDAADPVGGHGTADHGDHGHESGEHETGGHDTGGHDSGGHDSGGHDTGSHDSGEHGSGEHGSETGHDSGGASEANCADLSSICHDTTDDMGTMCHDIGHDGDEAACAKAWDACIAHCQG